MPRVSKKFCNLLWQYKIDKFKNTLQFVSAYVYWEENSLQSYCTTHYTWFSYQMCLQIVCNLLSQYHAEFLNPKNNFFQEWPSDRIIFQYYQQVYKNYKYTFG